MPAKLDVRRIGEALNMPGIVGAWLFGSACTGISPDSGDVDIGLLFATTPELDTLLECRARLQQVLGIEQIDLTVLNKASPILRFEALQGVRVFCGDEGRCAEFASLTAREYEDEMAFCHRGLRLAAELMRSHTSPPSQRPAGSGLSAKKQCEAPTGSA